MKKEKSDLNSIIVIVVTGCLILFGFLVAKQLKSQTNINNEQQVNTKKLNTLSLKNIEQGYPYFAISDTDIIKHKYYHVSYNKKNEVANWTAHILTKKMVKSGKVARENIFRSDPNYSKCSSTPSDYRRSGYDKGHLVPAADMNWSKDALDETFFMTNIAPQLHEFNAGIWEELENNIRKWTVDNDSLYIITGTVVNDIHKTIGKNEVAVPEYFFKVILDISEKDGYKAIAFLIRHEYSNRYLFDYAMSVKKLEERLGHTFFPDIDSTLIYPVKSKLNLYAWKKLHKKIKLRKQ